MSQLWSWNWGRDLGKNRPSSPIWNWCLSQSINRRIITDFHINGVTIDENTLEGFQSHFCRVGGVELGISEACMFSRFGVCWQMNLSHKTLGRKDILQDLFRHIEADIPNEQ
jgi:hypothetical protein